MTINCKVCDKPIYTHQFVVYCSLENHLYHSKCLNINNSTSTDILTSSSSCSSNEWWCSLCLSDILPFYQFLSSSDEAKVDKCGSCTNFISPFNHKYAYCTNCGDVNHDSCIVNYLCIHCNTEPTVTGQYILDDRVFDPFACLVDSTHGPQDDQINNHASLVSNILQSCTYNNDLNTNAVSLSTMFVNIDGVKSNFNEFEHFATSSKSTCDHYALCETNIKSSDPNVYSIPGYTHHKLLCKEGKCKGSGISIHCRQSLEFKQHKLVQTQSLEALCGTIKVKNTFVSILTIYRFHDRDFDFDIFIDDLTELLGNCTGSTIIFGDFNLDCFSNTSRVREYCSVMAEHGFSPTISRATNFTSTSATLIDQIWVNIPELVSSSSVLTTDISTHKPITCELSIETDQQFDAQSDVQPITYHDFSSLKIEPN